MQTSKLDPRSNELTNATDIPRYRSVSDAIYDPMKSDEQPNLDTTIAVAPYAAAVNDALDEFVNRALASNRSKDALDVIVSALVASTGKVSRIALTLTQLTALSEHMDSVDKTGLELRVDDASRLLGTMRQVLADTETSVDIKIQLCEIIDRIMGRPIAEVETTLSDMVDSVLQHSLAISIMCNNLKIKQTVVQSDSWWTRTKKHLM